MKIWTITQGAIGMDNQCIGVAERLSDDIAVKHIALREPWRTLTPWLGLERAWTFTAGDIAPPWPDVAIGCGRKSIAALRYIKRRSGGRTFTCFIQNPKIDTGAFDLVAIPGHDSRRGPNVVVTQAATNRLGPERMRREKDRWAAVFEPIRQPRVAVLIGGKSRTHDLTPANVDDLIARLGDLARDHGLMVTLSRRTPPEAASRLRAALGDRCYIWDDTGENPFFGMLAWADFAIVTSDSVSMISEAATAGPAVYIYPIEGGSERFDRFHDSLIAKGMIRKFTGSLTPFSPPPLDDAGMVADAITARMAARRR